MLTDWYAGRGVEHAHCPNGCEKPQPAMLGGRLLCMKCLVLSGVEAEMIPCTPDVCD